MSQGYCTFNKEEDMEEDLPQGLASQLVHSKTLLHLVHSPLKTCLVILLPERTSTPVSQTLKSHGKILYCVLECFYLLYRPI